MIKTKSVQVTKKQVELFVCDKCGKSISPEDWQEFNEVCSIQFTGGYASIFGDDVEITCDLCQYCLKELIGEYCTYRSKK